MYGWTRVITWRDVARVVNAVIPTASSDEEMPRIVLFSGTHGDELGHLVNDAASRGFVTEDQNTADNVMADNEGVQIEVVDVVTSYGTKDELTSIYLEVLSKELIYEFDDGKDLGNGWYEITVPLSDFELETPTIKTFSIHSGLNKSGIFYITDVQLMNN